jgi:hypothetical protein
MNRINAPLFIAATVVARLTFTAIPPAAIAEAARTPAPKARSWPTADGIPASGSNKALHEVINGVDLRKAVQASTG